MPKPYFYKSLWICLLSGILVYCTVVIVQATDWSAKQKETEKITQWIQRRLALAQQQQNTEILIESHKRMALLFEQQKNWDSLIYHKEQWDTLKKRYSEQEQEIFALQIEAEHIINQQEKELLQLQQAALLEKEEAHQNDIIQWSIISILLISLLAVLWIFFLKRKHNQALVKGLKEIEEQHAEKELLLKEIHHRVKNNLQVVTSLLHLQSYDIQTPEIKALFEQSQYRINSMAMIHEMLYQSHKLEAIDYKIYLEQLVSNLLRSVKGSATPIQLNTDIAPIELNIDTAIPLGLLINELITNALKYGLEKGKDSVLTVRLKPVHSDLFLLEISDNGQGMSSDWVPSEHPSSLGLRLVRKLARQLDGDLNRLPTKTGTHYQLYFKEISVIT